MVRRELLDHVLLESHTRSSVRVICVKERLSGQPDLLGEVMLRAGVISGTVRFRPIPMRWQPCLWLTSEVA